jgi:hypothetical protein
MSAAVDLERTGEKADAELAHTLRGLVARDQARWHKRARAAVPAPEPRG